MSKRIGIDARWIKREVSGIGRYTDRLIHALSKIDKDNLYFLFFSDKEVQSQFSKSFSYARHPNFNPIYFPYSPFSPIGFLKINKVIQQFKLDLFHSTNFMIPMLATQTQLVATIHDLIPLIHPEYTPKAKKTRFYPLYSFLMRCIGRRAHLILADSEHSRRDIYRSLKISENKVRRIYIGMDEKYKPATQATLPKEIKQKFGITKDYFLYVGRHDPYKNILGLVQAYYGYLKQVPQGAQLVITGKRDPRYPEAYKWCEKKNLLGQVVFTDYVSDEELLPLYQHAQATILVSLYEGFGLPVLESMACGVPVISSDLSSLPEVAGEASLSVSPHSLEAIVSAMVRLSQEETLRQELIQKGLEQVKKFSWDNCARETLEVYNFLFTFSLI